MWIPIAVVENEALSTGSPPVSGYIAWYDSSDYSSLRVSANSVTTMVDKAGSGVNATGGSRILLMRQYERELGALAMSLLGFTTTLSASDISSSAFFVGCPDQFPGGGLIMVQSTGGIGGIDFYLNSSGQLVLDKSGVANIGTTTFATSAGIPAVYGYRLSAGDVVLSINALSETDVHAQTLTASRTVALWPSWSGWVSEAIFYDTTLSTGDANSVIAYLMNKWGT